MACNSAVSERGVEVERLHRWELRSYALISAGGASRHMTDLMPTGCDGGHNGNFYTLLHSGVTSHLIAVIC